MITDIGGPPSIDHHHPSPPPCYESEVDITATNAVRYCKLATTNLYIFLLQTFYTLNKSLKIIHNLNYNAATVSLLCPHHI